MRQQSYLVRKGARYHFRRRIRHQATSRPISISLGTAEPDEARRLARRLAVKWDELEMTIEASSRSKLTVEERAAIFRAGMEAELATAVGDLAAPRRVSDGQPGFQKIMAGAYSAILNVAADADGVPDEIGDQVTKGDWTDEERHLVRQMLAAFVTPAEIDAARLEAALLKVGAPLSASSEKSVEAARQVPGSRIEPAHDQSWVEKRMAAFRHF